MSPTLVDEKSGIDVQAIRFGSVGLRSYLTSTTNTTLASFLTDKFYAKYSVFNEISVKCETSNVWDSLKV